MHIENSHPFSYETAGFSITGRATVCEVRPCIFVFTIYEGDFNSGIATQTMVTAIKPESTSLDELRPKCIPPTERDEEAVQRWGRSRRPEMHPEQTGRIKCYDPK